MKNRSNIRRAIILIGVVIIPLAYSLFYLAAFWDPYSRLAQLPVAVVNLDRGAAIDGTQRNLGDEMVRNMKDDDSLKWVFTDADTAARGLDDHSWYATITIPANFSADIASASTTDKVQAQITYSSDETRNFLAAQILSKAMLTLEEETRATVTGELTQSLSDKLNAVPDQLGELNDGLSALQDGANQLNSGAADARDGADKLNTGASDVHKGSTQLASGTAQLAAGANDARNGAKDLDGGIGKLQTGAGTLNKGLTDLNTGLIQVADGAKALNDGAQQAAALAAGTTQLDAGAQSLHTGVEQYVAGVNQLISQSQTVAQVLGAYVAANPAVLADPTLGPVLASLAGSSDQLAALTQAGNDVKSGAQQVAAASSQVSAGAANLPALASGAADLSASMQQALDGSARLKAGSADLIDGLKGVKAGSAKLVAGVTVLAGGAAHVKDGVADLNAGTSALARGADDLAQGTAKLKNGTADLVDGVGTAQTNVSDAQTKARDELDATDGLSGYAQAPVAVQSNPVHPVPNYGTAFAPYFMSLSLWVGAIILFVGVYLDPDNRFPALGRKSNHRMARVAAFFCVGLVQSLGLAFLVQHVLHLAVGNEWTFYLSCVLVSVVFTAVVEFLIVNLGDAGKFFALIFLILQLTACGGTFPMETLPGFFRAIYRFMPMTYSVNLFKDVIGQASGAGSNVSVLVCIFVVFTVLSVGLDALRKNNRKGLPAALEIN